MKLLDLFSGGKSLEKPCSDMGIEYYSVDIDPKLNPDLVADINSISADQIPFHPDIVWASPPCECFSVASLGKYWNKDNTPKNNRAKNALRLVVNAYSLIYYLKPKYWFIENPRGKLRTFKVMDNLPYRRTVTYCQYGDTRMKPTDIWTNCAEWKPRPMCKNGDPCHVRAPRGSRTGTQSNKSYIEKSAMPYDLLVEILESCMVR